MLSQSQIAQLVSDNTRLSAEVQELNEILSIKQEEIDELKKSLAGDTALRSMMDLQKTELQGLQNKIGQQQQITKGVQAREMELEQELTEASKIYHQYKNLHQQNTYLSVQLADLQQEIETLKKRNAMLQQITVKIGEIESNQDNLIAERDELIFKINELKKIQSI
jgi:chromosome segregation ATPase